MNTPGNAVRRILVVDDDPAICDTIRMVLADQYEVETVTSGQSALAAFQPAKFDLLILDYVMPDMKGDKLAAAIKAQAPRQPILLMTAYGEALRFGGTFPLGVDLVMGKPFDIKEFQAAVTRLTADS
jgi:DNA-binding response OmpR family regulator